MNRPTTRSKATSFTEKPVWDGIGDGWHHLHGDFRDCGFSIEWHDFEAADDFDWSGSFHPDSVEICLNLAGTGCVQTRQRRLELEPLTGGFYRQGEPGLRGQRNAGERHQFITVELASSFLEQHLRTAENLHPQLAHQAKAQVSEPTRLGTAHQQLISTLRHPPVYAGAREMWYHAKALEVAAAFLFRPDAADELFCERQNRLNQERVESVTALLRENLADTPSLEEIGRRVGCSHFHLSRVFSQTTGKSIFQFLRELRLERAAELLREGKLTVTQVALDVGYSSPSHFSTSFHEAYGCCPGLYPTATSTQKAGRKHRPG